MKIEIFSLQNKIYDVKNYSTLCRENNFCYYLALNIERLGLDPDYHLW